LSAINALPPFAGSEDLDEIKQGYAGENKTGENKTAENKTGGIKIA
jgi:hypothetical protein